LAIEYGSSSVAKWRVPLSTCPTLSALATREPSQTYRYGGDDNG
jgi:hypothetical protein